MSLVTRVAKSPATIRVSTPIRLMLDTVTAHLPVEICLPLQGIVVPSNGSF